MHILERTELGHQFIWGENGKKKKKKPSSRQDLNPRPLEFLLLELVLYCCDTTDGTAWQNIHSRRPIRNFELRPQPDKPWNSASNTSKMLATAMSCNHKASSVNFATENYFSFSLCRRCLAWKNLHSRTLTPAFLGNNYALVRLLVSLARVI